MDSALLRLGSRGSPLALVQAELVAEALQKAHPGLEVTITVVRTAPDRAPHVPLSAIGDKALWVADLEQQLLSGAIDLAVHSMKDVPADLPPGLCIGAVPERECPLDALVLPLSRGACSPELSDPAYVNSPRHADQVEEALNRLLPQGARVGTSSDRRKGQLLSWRPDLSIGPVRGNVDTRLAKLDQDRWDALVLAAAGLLRLGRRERISVLFPARQMLPAAGQGALAIEIREGDELVQALVQGLEHGPTAAAVGAERSFVRTVGGGCSVPLGVYTTFLRGGMELSVCAVEPGWRPGALPPLLDREAAELPGHAPFANLEWAVTLGRSLGERFLSHGGAAFLEGLKPPATA